MSRRRARRCLLLVAGLGSSAPGCGSDPAAMSDASGGSETSVGGSETGAVDSESGQTPPSEPFAAFDAVVEDFLRENGLEGATAAIVHRDDGVLHLRPYGDFDVDRPVLIASASKIISVGVLMTLADDGLLDLDTPISTYLSDWGDHKADITVAQLLSNSSGMIGLADALYLAYQCQFFAEQTLEACGEALYTANDEVDRAPPDTEFRYGGAQWQLAGAVAEVVSGQPWATLVQQTYAPCGLGSTAFRNHFLQATQVDGTGDGLVYPSFVDGDMSVLEPTDNPSIEGGAFSTASDYAQLLLMQLRGGQCEGGPVMSAASVERMQADRILAAYEGSTPLPAFPGYGMGWWVARDRPVIGDFGAYGTGPWLELERGYGVVVLIEGVEWMGPALLERVAPVLDDYFDQRG